MAWRPAFSRATSAKHCAWLTVCKYAAFYFLYFDFFFLVLFFVAKRALNGHASFDLIISHRLAQFSSTHTTKLTWRSPLVDSKCPALEKTSVGDFSHFSHSSDSSHFSHSSDSSHPSHSFHFSLSLSLFFSRFHSVLFKVHRHREISCFRSWCDQWIPANESGHHRVLKKRLPRFFPSPRIRWPFRRSHASGNSGNPFPSVLVLCFIIPE